MGLYTTLEHKWDKEFFEPTQLHLGIKQQEVRHPKTPQECAVRTRSASSLLHLRIPVAQATLSWRF